VSQRSWWAAQRGRGGGKRAVYSRWHRIDGRWSGVDGRHSRLRLLLPTHGVHTDLLANLDPPSSRPSAASEAIAAGRLQGAPGAYVLLHARVTPSALECRIKSADAGLTAAFAAAAAARMR
jgi:hypothetical protein